jgi:hypothetical protein
MATTRTIESIGRSSSIYIVTWGALANGESGDAIIAPNLTDATVHMYGTFGGGTLALQGSNDTAAGTSNWFTLSEPDGTLISGISSIDGAQILESPYQFRPVVTGGGGTTDLVVKLKVVANGSLSLNPQIIKVI